MSTNDPLALIAKQLPTVCLFIAASKSGKSYMLRYIIEKLSLDKGMFNYGLVLTGSPYNHEYGFLPKKAVHQYDEETLKEYIDGLKKLKDEAGGADMPHSFLVLDDCLGLITKTPAWTNLIGTYRHLGITLFITTQYLKAGDASGTLVREQTGVAFLFKNGNMNTKKVLFDYFGNNVLPKLEDFLVRYDRCTEKKYHCMMYINDPDLMDLQHNLLSIRAPADVALRSIDF